MSQRSKIEIVEDIKNSFGNGNLMLLGELLLRIITEARFSNDVDKGDDVILNQGEIRCCADIARYLDITLDNFKE